MADFDRAYQHSAEVIEAQLIHAGLPTLAAVVRPGVGRRGRPLKTRPVDLYPDLVEQVRAEGLIDLDVTVSDADWNGARGPAAGSKEAGEGSARHSVSTDDAGNGNKADRSVSRDARKGSAGEEKIRQPLHEQPGNEEKSRQLFHERSEDEEKSRQLFHERSEDVGKSQHLLHERSEDVEKSEQPLHKPTTGETSDVFSRFMLSPPIATCGQDPRRRDLSRRPGGPSTGRSPLRQEPRAKPSWWQKLLRVS